MCTLAGHKTGCFHLVFAPIKLNLTDVYSLIIHMSLSTHWGQANCQDFKGHSPYFQQQHNSVICNWFSLYLDYKLTYKVESVVEVLFDILGGIIWRC